MKIGDSILRWAICAFVITVSVIALVLASDYIERFAGIDLSAAPGHVVAIDKILIVICGIGTAMGSDKSAELNRILGHLIWCGTMIMEALVVLPVLLSYGVQPLGWNHLVLLLVYYVFGAMLYLLYKLLMSKVLVSKPEAG